MIPLLRQPYNQNFTREKHAAFVERMTELCGVPVPFRLCETPCFFPQELLEGMSQAGKELIRQLVDSPEYYSLSSTAIPGKFNVPNESKYPMFIQVDFGLIRDREGQLKPKLVELQAFPSLYAYQPVLASAYIDTFGLDNRLKYLLSGLGDDTYKDLLRRAIVGEHNPENVILMEIDPLHQKTLPDFLLTEKILGVRAVCVTKLRKRGKQLFYTQDGKEIPIYRIYNRAIVDELERKGIQLGFDFRDDLDVQWAGHPNWYFRISKFSIPYLRHETVPKTWFLDRMSSIPEDLQNYALKPLYSFAGLGVVIGPSKSDIENIPSEKRADYILQERLQFEPMIETPFGKTKAEIRIMYIWLDELLPVTTIIRMGRGSQMGVDFNKDMEWVGSSAGLYI